MSFNMTTLAAIGLVLTVSFAAQEGFAQSKKMSGEEIATEFSGKSHKATGSIWAGDITHNADGTLSGFDTVSGSKFTGNWSVKGNRYCWKSKPSGWSGCGNAKRKSDGSVKISNYGTLTAN